MHGKVVIADLNGDVFVYDGSTMFPTPQLLGGTGFLASVGGCASDGHGSVYISDIFVGNVMKLSLNDMSLTQVGEGLNFPTGVAVAKDGTVYVANNGVCPSWLTLPEPPCSGSGEVDRLHSR